MAFQQRRQEMGRERERRQLVRQREVMGERLVNLLLYMLGENLIQMLTRNQLAFTRVLHC